MTRIKIILSYVGTKYCGWQIQEKPHPPPTIQGELEKIVRQVVGSHVRIHGAGRTDSGVHAEAQVAHMDVPNTKAHLDWQRIFNNTLPHDISIIKAEIVPAHFHSRFDALQKSYVYTYWCENTFMPPRLRPFAWNIGHLDVEAMHKALPYLLGTHDFASLQNIGTPLETTVRTITRIQLQNHCAWLPQDLQQHTLTLTVQANGFLKQMVRNMAGLLAAIGKHKMHPEEIPALLNMRLRAKAPPTAPARGLSLCRIWY